MPSEFTHWCRIHPKFYFFSLHDLMFLTTLMTIHQCKKKDSTSMCRLRSQNSTEGKIGLVTLSRSATTSFLRVYWTSFLLACHTIETLQGEHRRRTDGRTLHWDYALHQCQKIAKKDKQICTQNVTRCRLISQFN